MLSRRNFALGIAMLTTAGIAVAAQPPALVIRVQCVVSDRSAERVEDILTSPLEQTLKVLPRVVNMASVTGNSSKGVTVDLEIHFEGGATGQDLVTVLGLVARFEFSRDIGPSSVSVDLGSPHIDKDTVLPLR